MNQILFSGCFKSWEGSVGVLVSQRGRFAVIRHCETLNMPSVFNFIPFLAFLPWVSLFHPNLVNV